jgi:hypothetical protein
MLKNTFVVAALVLLGASSSLAQTPPPEARVENTHKSYDQKARECRKLARGQGLSGEALRAFIADCVKH